MIPAVILFLLLLVEEAEIRCCLHGPEHPEPGDI
ncbi:rCG20156, isoform CRA_c [Rattus norvegicus]|uniref:RCG20156, isoform CRA_c n=1 Tax=Rattus norvegicus TaxID=10116 RepID=A6JFV9_RAT|nr:rCG20156, isoform CRA_c [Rattus norvegicus]